MRILVTGGAGYIGTTLVPLLLEKGYEVCVFDSLMYGGDPILPFFRHPKFEFVHGDIREEASVTRVAQGCDAVVHLAAIVGFPACRKYPDLAEGVNVDGARVVARAVGRETLVLFGSTGSNYGAITEEVCTEETQLNPASLYGRTKVAAERQLLNECTTIAFRFATAFGVSPRMRLDLLVNDFVHRAVKERYLVVYEAHFMRTFIHVHDIARSFLFALENADKMKGQVYNVGSKKLNYTKAGVCELIKEQVDYYLHYADVGEDADRRNYLVSYDKIEEACFRPTIAMEEGIAELVRAMDALPSRPPYGNA